MTSRTEIIGTVQEFHRIEPRGGVIAILEGEHGWRLGRSRFYINVNGIEYGFLVLDINHRLRTKDYTRVIYKADFDVPVDFNPVGSCFYVKLGDEE